MTYDEILSSMQDRFTELTGVSADDASDIGIRMKVLASQLEKLYSEVEDQYRQIYPQTATGEYLDRHAFVRGLTRKTAQPSSGSLQFSRETPVSYNINIPQGTVCAVGGDVTVRFETTQDAVLPAGGTSVTVPARAQTGGTSGNVASAVVTVMIVPPTGVTAVTNPVPFTGGTNDEDDESLRERLLKTYSEISNGTNSAFYYNTAMAYSDITSCSVIPRNRGRGTVDVVVSTGGSAPSTALLNALQADFNARREISVDVLVLPVVPVMIDVGISVAVKTGYSSAVVRESCSQAVAEFFSRLQIGEPLLLAALGAAIFAVPGVRNYTITSHDNDVLINYDELFILDEADVTIAE